MSMYLESLHVKNVGPFDSLEVKFNPKMNVIIGANGVGKTSLLRCITNSMSPYALENTRFRKDATIKAYGFIGDKRYCFGAERIVDEDQKYRQTSVNRWLLEKEEGVDNRVLTLENEYNLLTIGAYRYVAYKKIDGLIREDSADEERRKYQMSNPSYLDSQSMPDIKQWMINRYFQIEKEWARNEKKNWEQIKSNLSVIAPNDCDFRFERIERDLEPVFSLNGRECYLEELSSGFKSVLSIVLNITNWIERINENDQMRIENAEGTVLIDEIDAHLHPSWQSTVLGSLRKIFPRLQFIVTTHSPNVIMSAKAREVILFDNNDGNVNMEPDERDFGAWQFNDILSDLMKSPGLDRVSVVPLLSQLNRAYDEKDVEKYKASLTEVAKKLNPNDSILKIYNLKLSELLLGL